MAPKTSNWETLERFLRTVKSSLCHLLVVECDVQNADLAELQAPGLLQVMETCTSYGIREMFSCNLGNVSMALGKCPRPEIGCLC